VSTETTSQETPNRRMQSDQNAHYARTLAADLSVRRQIYLVTCNVMRYNIRHDSELQAQGIGEVFF